MKGWKQALLAMLMAGLVALVGCSSDSGDDDNNNPTGPTLEAPEITAVNVTEGQIGITTTVQLTGTGLSEMTAESRSTLVTVTLTAQQDTLATLTLTVAPEAMPGTDSVVVMNDEGSDGFEFKRTPANLSVMTWTQGPDLPMARYGLTGVEVDGNVYVIGGADADNNVVNNVDILDPNTNTWTTGPNLPSARAFQAAAALDGKIYVVGGVTATEVLAALDVLDVSTNTWTNLQVAPSARFGAGAGATGGKVYVVGGWNGQNLVTATESFDLNANQWTTLAPMPTARELFAAVPVNDRVYAVGGDDGQQYLATTQYFNTGANTWSTATSMPTARNYTAGALYLGNLVIVGGETPDGNATVSTTVVEALNLETNTWSTVTALPAGRDTHCVVAADGKLYVIGGGRVNGQNYDLVTTTLIGALP